MSKNIFVYFDFAYDHWRRTFYWNLSLILYSVCFIEIDSGRKALTSSTSLYKHERRKGGGRGARPHLDFENFSKKRLFSWFLVEKKQISPLLAPPGKFLEKSPSGPPWKKILPTPVYTGRRMLMWTKHAAVWVAWFSWMTLKCFVHCRISWDKAELYSPRLFSIAFLFLPAFFQNTKVEDGQKFKPCVIQMGQDHVATIYKMEIAVDPQIIRAIARSKLKKNSFCFGFVSGFSFNNCS